MGVEGPEPLDGREGPEVFDIVLIVPGRRHRASSALSEPEGVAMLESVLSLRHLRGRNGVAVLGWVMEVFIKVKPHQCVYHYKHRP